MRRERDVPQSVMFALHSAASCGFEFEYASMITHFLEEGKVSP